MLLGKGQERSLVLWPDEPMATVSNGLAYMQQHKVGHGVASIWYNKPSCSRWFFSGSIAIMN